MTELLRAVETDTVPVSATRLRSEDGFGVDRLSLSFRVKEWLDLDRWSQVTTRAGGDGWSAQTTVGTADSPPVMVGVRALPHGAVWGKVECNPARFVDPDGCGLLPARLLGPAMETMWAAALHMVTPYDGDVGSASVKRLDVARDFRNIMSPGLYVEGLAPLRRSWARRTGVWSDASLGNAQTLHVGSGAGMVRLYDQFAAYGAEKGAPEGSLRWEVEARAEWLEKVDVVRAEQLDAVAVQRVAEQRWEWSRMGERVSGPVHAVEVLQSKVRSGDLKQGVADRLLGAMVRQSLGYGQQSRATEWRHRETLRAVGLTSETLWSDDLSRQAVGRLDFETGTEFLELSA